jgi:putative endonuclease
MKSLMSLPAGTLGYWGEDLAVKYLEKQKFRILCRNYYCRGGEIDIISIDSDGQLVFFEVKTRHGGGEGTAEASFSYKKRTRMLRAAGNYLSEQEAIFFGEENYRFDGLLILIGHDSHKITIKHIKSLFS